MQRRQNLDRLLIPATTKVVQPRNVLDASFKTYITFEEVNGYQYTIDALIDDLSHLAIEDCLLQISIILVVLDNNNNGHDDQRTQRELAHVLFSGAILSKVQDLLGQQPGRLVFFESQLLALFKYVVLHARHEAASNFDDGRTFHIFARVLLGITDILIPSRGSWTKQELQEEAIRNFFFSAKQDFKRSLSRTYELYSRIAQQLEQPHPVDIQATFQSATEISLDDFLMLGFVLMSHSLLQRTTNSSSNNWSINRNTFFSEMNVNDESIDILFKECSTTTDELARVFQKQEKGKSFIYNYEGLVQHPLVTYDGTRYAPLSQRYVKEKITRQIYWILFDYIKKSSNDNDKVMREYSSFMGSVFEEYVYESLQRIFPSHTALNQSRLTREKTYRVKRREKKTVDNIVLYPNALLLLETKISQLKVKTGVQGSLDAFRDDVAKIVLKSVETIQRTKRDYQSGLFEIDSRITPKDIRRYVPVIVTYDMFPTHPLLWDIVEDVVNTQAQGPIDRDIMENLQIVEIDELEAIEHLVGSGAASLLDLIDDKNGSRVYKRLPFSNYLSDTYPNYILTMRDHLSSVLDGFAERMTLRLFGRP